MMLKEQKNNYNEVSSKTWIYSDLKKKNLRSSLSLFNFTKKKIIPKKLKVIALLSGLPFSKKLTNKIVSAQCSVDKIIGHHKHYWVKKKNFGLEYCVFKWPEQNLSKTEINELLNIVSKLKFRNFDVLFDGCQLNPDGCVVIRGFDISKNIFNLRRLIAKKINFLPKKQSKWFHIPIGRILEPVGEKNFLKLKFFFDKNSSGWKHYEEINSIKLIHEYQWYMEKKITLLHIKKQSTN
jgi:hypothetical protein